MMSLISLVTICHHTVITLLIRFFSSVFLRWKLRLLIWDFLFFTMYAFSAINFSLSILFLLFPTTFGMLYFHFHSLPCLISPPTPRVSLLAMDYLETHWVQCFPFTDKVSQFLDLSCLVCFICFIGKKQSPVRDGFTAPQTQVHLHLTNLEVTEFISLLLRCNPWSQSPKLLFKVFLGKIF